MRLGIVLVPLLLAGCATREVRLVPAPGDPALTENQNYRVRNQGYSLLYDLVSDEKDVAKVLLIKREHPQVRAIIQEISSFAGQLQKQLDQFSLEDPQLNFKTPGLPFIEAKAREAIGSRRAKQLLLAGGQDFEVDLLLTQVEATGYGGGLAEVLAEQESIPKRKMFLVTAAKRFQELNRGCALLLELRNDPAKRR
jgi:hypothetical protein